MYYIIIFVVSMILMLVLPMFSSNGTNISFAFIFPTTTIGWIVYIGTSLVNSLANLFIFFSFMSQGKVNIRDEPKFKEANQILLDLSLRHADLQAVPRSPKRWKTYQYSHKGTSLFLGSLFSAFALTNAILAFDVVALVSYAISVVFILIFGYFQMKTSEEYWTEEYYRYAKLEEKKYAEAEYAEAEKEVIINDKDR